MIVTRLFATSGHLTRHQLVHTGEMNYACTFPGCTTRCSRKDNLRQHYRLHFDSRDPEELKRSAPEKRRRKARVARFNDADSPGQQWTEYVPRSSSNRGPSSSNADSSPILAAQSFGSRTPTRYSASTPFSGNDKVSSTLNMARYAPPLTSAHMIPTQPWPSATNRNAGPFPSPHQTALYPQNAYPYPQPMAQYAPPSSNNPGGAHPFSPSMPNAAYGSPDNRVNQAPRDDHSLQNRSFRPGPGAP
ncbi:hypothetical protein MSAN_01904900 [Mycena sanguinolenta]|uniref:C2H2-type domain-containing protein n=1 Tax=Mycena sanguinolenta TaxID=230812 RepID=A0A8H7CR83_9AGAR|nr:hypothetical protein MSAN_01904900 [Mycena sanguinolenta]